MTSRKRAEGAQVALEAMRKVARGWAEGAAENDDAGHVWDRKPVEEQTFVLDDILRMVNDAARVVGEVKPRPVPPTSKRSFTVNLAWPFGITESFSIMEGDTLSVRLSGTVSGLNDGVTPVHLEVPVQIVIR